MLEKNIIQKIVVGAVVFKDSKILILQRNKDEKILPNIWELPSGKKENLEKVETALRREIKEETGLDVELARPFSVFSYQIKKEVEIRDTVQINFIAKYLGGEVVLSEEHGDFHWLSIDEIDKYNITEETKKVIKMAFELDNKS